MKISFSLYFQVAAIFVLISILTAAGVGTLNYIESRNIIVRQFDKSMNGIVANIGASLNARTDDAAAAIMRISRNEQLLAENAADIQRFLQVAVDSSSLFNNIYLFSAAGPLKAVAYDDGRDLARYAEENYINYAENEKTRAVYLDLVSALETRQPVFSDFFKSTTGRLMNSFIVPIVHDGEVRGLLSCGIVLDNTSKLLEQMERLKPHPEGYIALTGANGVVLLSAGKMPDSFVSGSSGQTPVESLIRNSGYLQTACQLEKTGIGICIGIPETAIAGFLESLSAGTILFTVVGAVFASLLGLFAASVLIAPLNALISGLRQLRSGKPGARIECRASGEIAEAVDAYNELSEKVKKDALLNKTWTDLWNA